MEVRCCVSVNPLNAELNPICYLLALLGAHHIFHVSVLRVNFGHEVKAMERKPVMYFVVIT